MTVAPVVAASPTLASSSAAALATATPTLAATANPAATVVPTPQAAPSRQAAAATAAPDADERRRQEYPRPELLADRGLLARQLDSGQAMPKLVELSSAEEFARGHLPGAVNVQWPELNLTDSADATIARWRGAMEAKLGALGIAPRDAVVVYDDGSLWAARVWWVLRQLGQPTVQVLDGGKPAWEAAAQTLSSETPAPVATTYRATPDASSLITADELHARLGSSDLALVDARSEAEFSGRDNSGARRPGHIPGAVNIPYTRTARAEPPRTFLAAPDLLPLYADRGVTPDKETVAYCSTGVRSAVTYFTLLLLGFPRVRLYSPSYAEWGNRDDLPVER